MFTVQRVHDCPHTKGNGVVRITPEVLTQLSGAVWEKDEWAVILTGERSADGKNVTVSGMRLPEQTRSHADVEVGDTTLYANDVAVLHSHNTYGPFFSQTDEDKLNPRFPLSIVISSRGAGGHYLGFTYKATGKVKLPCGSWGEMDFFIQPTEGPEIVQESFEAQGTKLGDCINKREISGDQYYAGWEAACGIKDEGFRVAAFGAQQELYDLIHAIPVVVYGKDGKVIGKKGYTVRINGKLVDDDYVPEKSAEESASVFVRNSTWDRVVDEGEAEKAADKWAAKQERKRLKRERREARKAARAALLDNTEEIVDVEQGTIKLEWDMEAWENEMCLSKGTEGLKRTM